MPRQDSSAISIITFQPQLQNISIMMYSISR